jgi:spermidine/putrescine transport system ATP-binding protein
VFVANFLGQSNLIDAEVVESGGPGVVVDIAGSRVRVDAARTGVRQGRAWLGVRPEKVGIADVSEALGENRNVLKGGMVTDVSFVGVSTQYLVRMPWGQELSVFEQNTGAHRPFARGAAVHLHWQPSHAFVLEREQGGGA